MPLALSWRASALAPCLVRREDHRPAGRAGQVDQDGEPVLTLEVQHVVGHRADRRLRRVGLVGLRLAQVLLDEHVDGLVERRGEEHPLSGGRRPAEQAAYGGQEAQVRHVVGLVEHGDRDVAEAAVPLADEVLEPAGAGDDDVGAGAQATDLGVLPDAAEDGLGLQADGRGQRGQGGLDLAHELTGGGQDQGPRGARAGAVLVGVEARDEREQEGVGLARAGAAAAEHVAAGERVGQRRGLDRGGDGDALVGEDGGELRGHAEVSEGNVRRQGEVALGGVSHPAVPPAAGGRSFEPHVEGRRGRRGQPEARLCGLLGSTLPV